MVSLLIRCENGIAESPDVIDRLKVSVVKKNAFVTCRRLFIPMCYEIPPPLLDFMRHDNPRENHVRKHSSMNMWTATGSSAIELV